MNRCTHCNDKITRAIFNANAGYCNDLWCKYFRMYHKERPPNVQRKEPESCCNKTNIEHEKNGFT